MEESPGGIGRWKSLDGIGRAGARSVAGRAPKRVRSSVRLGDDRTIAMEDRGGNVDSLAGSSVGERIARDAIKGRVENPPDAGAAAWKAGKLARTEMMKKLGVRRKPLMGPCRARGDGETQEDGRSARLVSQNDQRVLVVLEDVIPLRGEWDLPGSEGPGIIFYKSEMPTGGRNGLSRTLVEKTTKELDVNGHRG